jgi:hypothetical protein
VKLVERRVEIQVPLAPTRRDWPRLLGELAGQLNDGRVYDRDLPALARTPGARTGGLPATSAPHRRPVPALTLNLKGFCSNQKEPLEPPVG